MRLISSIYRKTGILVFWKLYINKNFNTLFTNSEYGNTKFSRLIETKKINLIGVITRIDFNLKYNTLQIFKCFR